MVRPSYKSLEDKSKNLINQDHEGGLFVDSANGGGSGIVTDEFNFVPYLVRVERFLLAIERGDFDYSYEEVTISYPGRELKSYMPSDDLAGAIELIRSKHALLPNELDDGNCIRAEVNPRIRLGINTLRQAVDPYFPQKPDRHGAYADRNFLDEFVNSIQRYLKLHYTHEEVSKRKHWKLLQRRHKSSIMGYVDHLLETWSSLYLIHLDLGVQVPRDNLVNDNYELLDSSLRMLLRNKHRNPFWADDLVGHICKLEWNVKQKLHARLFFFYKGDGWEKHQDDAKKIIDKWFDVTNKEGVVLSRIPRENRELLIPEKKGLMISFEESETVEELKRYLNYLIDLDQIFGLKNRGLVIFSRGKTVQKGGVNTVYSIGK